MAAGAPGARPATPGSTAACGAEARALRARRGESVTVCRADRSTAHGGYHAHARAPHRRIRDHPARGLLQPAHAPRRRALERRQRLAARRRKRATGRSGARLHAQSAVFGQRTAQHARADRRLQQFLRVRHRQGIPRQIRTHAQDPTLERDGAGRGGSARQVQPRGPAHGTGARGTHLSIPLRRGVVAGGAVDRLSSEPAAGALQAHLERQVCRVHDTLRSGADAGTALGGAQLAVRRGTADRRGDAPAHAHGGRTLRQGSAQPGRRAAAAHRALEVRLQEHQVDRADRLHCAPAQHRLECRRSAGVRVLRQRQPAGRSSTLESGHRAPHRRAVPGRTAADAALQRLRRAGREPVSGHGSAALLLNVTQRYRYLYKPLVFVAGVAPLAWMVCGALQLFGAGLGADPVKKLEHECGKTALNFLLLTLTVTPVRDLTGLPQLRRMLGLFAFFYAVVHFTVYLVLDLELNFRLLGADIVKRPYITIGFSALLLLLPLALTSTNGMMRRLGRRWQSLHRLIYPIAALAVWHFYWQVKRDVREPLLYVGMLALLLAYRVLRWRARRAP